MWRVCRKPQKTSGFLERDTLFVTWKKLKKKRKVIFTDTK
jgi:hypothetical protein